MTSLLRLLVKEIDYKKSLKDCFDEQNIGKRYETNNTNIKENTEKRHRISEESRTLTEEFASLQELSGMIDSLDDDIVDSVRELETVQTTETERFESEQEQADAEKEKITADINAEIDKLDAGVSKLDQLRSFEFGQKSVDAAEKTYRAEISQFKELLDELEDDDIDEVSKVESSESIESFEQTHSGEDYWAEGDTVQIPHSNNLVPTRSTPRDLSASEFGFNSDGNGNLVYDSPLEMAQYLYTSQGSVYEKFQGTCGLCSVVNVLRLSGVNIGEKEIIDYAAKGGLFSGLCVVNPISPRRSGGNTPKQRKQILDHFGISSSTWSVKKDKDGRVSIDTINDIGQWVSEGKGVIIDVDDEVFYDDPRYKGRGHVVTVTSVTKNKYDDVSGFYIADSNRGTSYFYAWQIQEAMRPFVDVNVTSQIIR